MRDLLEQGKVAKLEARSLWLFVALLFYFYKGKDGKSPAGGRGVADPVRAWKNPVLGFLVAAPCLIYKFPSAIIF